MPAARIPAAMAHWFRHKRTGFGVTPASPAGWAAIAGFVAVLIVGRLLLDASGRGMGLPYVLAMGAVVIGFAVLVWRTVEPRR